MPENLYYKQNENPLLWEANYEEEKVPPYILPDLLLCNNGEKITSSGEWESKRRGEILDFFNNVMYGKIPPEPDETIYEILSESGDSCFPSARRREIKMTFRMKNNKTHSVIVLLYLPASPAEKVPVFAGLTFFGNHVASCDPTIHITGSKGKKGGISPVDAEKERGEHVRRFPVKEILERGYALMIASYHDFFPDHPEGWEESIYSLFYGKEEMEKVPWENSAISAWAWGLSRLADLAGNIPEIHEKKMACYGHSRLGKASLWAGANDKRFSLVCVNDSGCGGAALSRRLFGETLFCMCKKNNMGFWYRKDLWEKTLAPEKLEMDQHGLFALVAPRSVSVHSATADRWADPYGEYLGAYHAGCVYRLFGKTPLPNESLPEAGCPEGSVVSYLLREGIHDIILEDWEQYMDAADRIFFNTKESI